MSYSKEELLDKAVEITKEYAKSSSNQYPSIILEDAYNKLKELNKDTKDRE